MCKCKYTNFFQIYMLLDEFLLKKRKPFPKGAAFALCSVRDILSNVHLCGFVALDFDIKTAFRIFNLNTLEVVEYRSFF